MADDVKQLLVSVDASVALLRQNLLRGDQVVQQFERGTNATLNKVDQRFARVGAPLKGLSATVARNRAEIATLGSSVEAVERRVRASSASMRSALLGATSAIAAAFSVDQVAQYADGYTRFTNQLRVAGLEGQALAGTQDKLYGIAQKYGVQLESVGTLYSRASQAATSLGASQAELIQFTNGVGAALKVQGGSAEEAQGALLQLSQLLASGTVHAEEFNSVNEGARPILQAVANGIDKYKGSVAALRADVLAGKLTSQDFFQGFLRGSGQLEQQAARSNLTIAASFTILNNALGKYIGETDAGLSATARISQAITALSQHLDVIVPALAAIGVGFATRFVVGPVTTAVAAVAALRAELFASNVIMLGGKAAAAAKAQAVAAAAQTEVAAIEATIAARRADQLALGQTLTLIQAQRADALQAQAAMAANAKLGFGTAVGAGRNDAARANQDLKAQITTKRALAVVDQELAAAEAELAAAQLRVAAASRVEAAAVAEATLAARAGAAASKLFAGGLTLIGGSVTGGAVVLTLGAITAGVLLVNSSLAAAEERNRATAAAMVETAARGRELNAHLAQTASLGVSAAGGIATVGAAAANSTGQVNTFAGAVGNLAAQLQNLAQARRHESTVSYLTTERDATLAADQAQARIDARRSRRAGRYRVRQDGDQQANTDDARIVAQNRAQADAAHRAAAAVATTPLGRFVRETDRPGGRDVPGDQARIARDLAIARQGGNKTQIRSLQADQFEVNQYAKYRKTGLSVEEANRQASADAARFRSATAEGAARADSARSARTGATAARAQAAAARDAAGDARAYTAAERQANDAIASARADLTGSAEERAKIEKQRIESDRLARNEELQDQLRQGRFGTGDTGKARVAELTRLNDQRAALEAQAVDAREKQRIADEQLAIGQATTDNQIELLQKQADVTTSLQQRRALELRILALQYQEERAKLEGVIASQASTDAEKEIARRRLEMLGQLQNADEQHAAQGSEGPIDQYRRRLHEATDDMRTALEQVKVNGLQSVEDGLLGVVTGTETVASAFKKMAGSIVADLARIAIEKALVSAIGGSFFGVKLAGGGEVKKLAGGGPVWGAGGPRSDSIPAMLSNGEYVLDAATTAAYRPMIEAMHAGRLPRFAGGGQVATSLSLPAIPSFAGMGRGGGGAAPVHITLAVKKGEAFEAEVISVSGPHTAAIIEASVPTLSEHAMVTTLAALRTPGL